jgi:hypothetical protein
MRCLEWQTRLEAYVDAKLPPHEMDSFRVPPPATVIARPPLSH